MKIEATRTELLQQNGGLFVDNVLNSVASDRDARREAARDRSDTDEFGPVDDSFGPLGYTKDDRLATNGADGKVKLQSPGSRNTTGLTQKIEEREKAGTLTDHFMTRTVTNFTRALARVVRNWYNAD